jgi:KDO2-lipid IV(A) lauroyltransferase
MVKNFMEFLLLGGLRVFATLYGFLPRPWQLAGGGLLGFGLRVLRFRAGVVEQNLRIAYPDAADEKKRARIFRESYAHFGNLIFEIILILGPMRRFVETYAELRGQEHLRTAHEHGRGVVFLASHLGNWEVMAGVGGLMADTDLMLVTKRLRPAWLHRAIEAGRLKYHVTATYEPRTLKDVLKHLKKNGTVGFVLDQYAGPPVGVRVPFFGVPVGTTQAVASLVRRTEAVVLPVKNWRTPAGKWVIEIMAPLPWRRENDPHYELAANTPKSSKQISASVPNSGFGRTVALKATCLRSERRNGINRGRAGSFFSLLGTLKYPRSGENCHSDIRK